MSKLHALMKTLPPLSLAAMKKGGPVKATNEAAHPESLLCLTAQHVSAIRPNLEAIGWLEKIVNEQSVDNARVAYFGLSDIHKATVLNGYLIKNNGKYRLSYDGSTYCSRFIVKPMLKSQYEFPLTTRAELFGGGIA